MMLLHPGIVTDAALASAVLANSSGVVSAPAAVDERPYIVIGQLGMLVIL